jgi:hypothetical protein
LGLALLDQMVLGTQVMVVVADPVVAVYLVVTAARVL